MSLVMWYRCIPLLSVCFAALIFSACGDQGGEAPSAVALNLTLGDVDPASVEYDIACIDGETIEGVLEVVPDRDPPIWGTIVGLPSGSCTVTLTALDDQGGVMCEGTGEVVVVPNDSTKVDIVLTCDGDTTDGEDDDYRDCPTIHSVASIPTTIPLGEVASRIALTVSDADEVSYYAASGSFVQENEDAVFTCSVPGPVEIVITASNRTCSLEAIKEVVCPDGDGLEDSGE